MGWKLNITIPLPPKSIICVAPHTSNWDFIIGLLYRNSEGFSSHFMMKKDWFFWPLGPIFRWMGGIAVDRGKKTSLVEQMVEVARSSRTFHLAITPEGTRKANPKWKRGFYYIAQGADIPILLVGIDYPSKCITIGREMRASGDIEKDMREIQQYFVQFRGLHPENFSIAE